MGVAISDAITVYNQLINYLFNLDIIGIPLGLLIIITGVIGACISMISNYRL